jgi:N utilization substance protein B
MSLPQQKFREIIFQLLYSQDMAQSKEEDVVPLIMAELAVTKKSVRSGLEKAQKIIAVQNELDQLITGASLAYSFERIPSVERNILRLGVFEMLYDEEIPPKVAIAEAIRLARKFGSPESSSFVNAILDNIYKKSQGEAIDTKELAKALEELDQSIAKAKENLENNPDAIPAE